MAEVVTCPACKGGQLKRRGDPLCPSCATAALEVAPSPSWALESPLLRRALADVNVPAVVAVVRAACGLSQRDLAEVAGWSPAVLSYYERGRRDAVFDVRVVLQFADGVGMPRSALLPLVLADPDAAGSNARPFPDCAPASTYHRPTSGRVRYWRACTDALHARDRQAGGTALLRAALLLRSQAAIALRGTAVAELPATVAGSLVYAGQAALDAGNLMLAKTLHDKAKDLAASSGDPVLTVQVLLAQSQVHATIARHGQSREPARLALLLAREAADEGRYEPVPQLHALIAVRAAQAAALLGDKPAFSAAITRAGRELDRHPPGDAMPLPGWLRHVTCADVLAAEAAGYLDLGETARAVALHRAVVEVASCPRDQALCTAGLAAALIANGNRAEAVTTALDVAVSAAENGVTSAGCLSQLRSVVAAAGTVQGVLELRERVNALCRAFPELPESGPRTPPVFSTVSA